MSNYTRITVAGRAFGVAAILGLALLSTDLEALQGTIVLAVLAAGASALATIANVRVLWTVSIEAALVGLLVGLMLPSTAALLLLPYLVVPALTAGLFAGLRGLLGVLAAGAVGVTVLGLIGMDSAEVRALLSLTGPWFLTSLGVGLLGMWFRHFTDVASRADESYESAHRLLTQLRTVARRLPSGLDTGSLAGELVTSIAHELDAPLVAAFVRTRAGLLTPLGYYGAAQGVLLPDNPLVKECWIEGEPVLDCATRDTGDCRAALPLRVGSRLFGVVMAQVPTMLARPRLETLMEGLDRHSLRLDTALTFDELRASATQEERHRLAREIHDGVAQDIASLGYIVDELSAGAMPGEQSRLLTSLRAELTRIVGELRHSIFELRSDVTAAAGLGTALSDYAREVGTRYGIKIHLSLEESSARLRSEVETELLRIAQEAITNARKHSGARNLWVECRVLPPHATVAVRDDGNGMRAPRDDSYGLKIMRERASRIDAHLTITPTGEVGKRPGTAVVVTVGSGPSDRPKTTVEDEV